MREEIDMTRIAFGMMRLPLFDEEDQTSVDFEHVDRMAELCMEKGVNFFDSAYPYHFGESEKAIKRAVVERYPRDSYIVSDKFPTMIIQEESQLQPIFDEQLERTGLDYFDYYMVHNVSEFSQHGWKDIDSFSFCKRMKDEGKIKKLGLSSHAQPKELDEILNDHPEMEFILLQLNYLDWENESIQSKGVYEVARKHNLPIFVMEPLKGGILANVPPEAEKLMRDCNGQSPVVWALRYFMGLEGVEVVLSGASTYEQLEENIGIFETAEPLNDEEMEVIKQVVEIINNNIAVDCTKCNYCLDYCPTDINIPKLFEFYNSDNIIGIEDWTPVGNAYINYARTGHPIASDCIECEACVNECPQHLPIPDLLQDVAKHFETPNNGF